MPIDTARIIALCKDVEAAEKALAKAQEALQRALGGSPSHKGAPKAPRPEKALQVEEEGPSRAAQVLDYLAAHPEGAYDAEALAEAIGLEGADPAFRSGLSRLLAKGRIESPERGRYAFKSAE